MTAEMKAPVKTAGPSLSRRSFLFQGALAGAGALAAGHVHAARSTGEETPRVRRYQPLGKTGLEISDVSFGSSRLRDEPELVLHAFDRGVNYFDSAHGYTGGVSETTLGKALRGKRDQVFLTSKVTTTATSRRGEMMQALEESLRRLRTDYVDVYFNHAVNDVGRVTNPEWHEFVSRAREQGKIRFSGMSGHAGRLVECLDQAIDDRSVDVVLVAYNFGQDPAFYQRFLKPFDMVAVQPDLPRVLSRAKAAGIGVVAMKTLMGARLNDMTPFQKDGATFSQAAFRWVLSNPDVDALIVSMTGRRQIDEYLGASGARALAPGDLPLLVRYATRHGDSTCRFGCDLCHAACPEGVEISSVLRARMYAADYGDPEVARDEYRQIARDATACLSCAHRACTGACPWDVPIARNTAGTHRWLA